MKSVIIAAGLGLSLVATGCTNKPRLLVNDEGEQHVCGGTNNPALWGIPGGLIGSFIGYGIGENRANGCVDEMIARGYSLKAF